MEALSLLLDMPRWGRVVFALALGWGIAWGGDVQAATVAFDPEAHRQITLGIFAVMSACVVTGLAAVVMMNNGDRP